MVQWMMILYQLPRRVSEATLKLLARSALSSWRKDQMGRAVDSDSCGTRSSGIRSVGLMESLHVQELNALRG